jgi:CBS-domain-containing membrane protein
LPHDGFPYNVSSLIGRPSKDPDMRCAEIMHERPLTLRDTDSIAQAAETLIAQRALSIPVVDGADCYVGMFGAEDLAGLVVPRIALAGGLAPNLRFIGDDAGELARRFRDLKSHPVRQAVDTSAVVLTPDTPQIEAFRIFCRSRAPLAVVDPASRKLLGVVAYWDVMGAIVADA